MGLKGFWKFYNPDNSPLPRGSQIGHMAAGVAALLYACRNLFSGHGPPISLRGALVAGYGGGSDGDYLLK